MTLRSIEPPHIIVDWRERQRARQWAERRAMVVRVVLCFLSGFVLGSVLMAALNRAHAEWKPQYAQADPAVQDWYESALITKAAQPRFPFIGCCNSSEVVRTKFQVAKDSGADQWFYLDPRDGKTKPVPPDIIHWGEHAPDGQPTLFVVTDTIADAYHLPRGTPTCFYPGEDGN